MESDIIIENIIKKLREHFSENEDVQLVFLFGSHVSNYASDESDVDIAILFEQTPGTATINQIRDNLSVFIKREIDIVILNDSSPIIRMQVLNNGLLAVNKDKTVYNNFFVKTVKDYDDLKRLRKEIEDNIMRGRIYA